MFRLTKLISREKPQASNKRFWILISVSVLSALMLLLYFVNRSRWPFYVFQVAISPSGDQLLVFHNTNFFIPTPIPSKHQVSFCDIQSQQVLWTSTIQRPFVARLMFSSEGTPVVLHESGYYSVFDKDGHATESRLPIRGIMRDTTIIDNDVFAINERGEWCHGDRSGTFEPKSLFDSKTYSSVAPDGKFIAVVNTRSAQQLHTQQIKNQNTQMIEFKDDIDFVCALKNQNILVVLRTGDCFLVTLNDNQAKPVVMYLISCTNIRSIGTYGRGMMNSTNDGSLFVLYSPYEKPLMNIIEKEGEDYKLTTLDCSHQLNRSEHSKFSQVVCSETKDICVWVSRFRKMGVVRKVNGTWKCESSF